uniref:malonyl-coenzyme A:anthocyanin 3-O-glucoside-6''-O-malonyltransferase-like n=1 Tax=Erigeron canadensis TaxID=72917 RepID=UPI001CB97A84|nr:malonyl-coenzyme A:anthocyanin 3-O-glucoside-6''-O-malonyltransferase-like [Erigeron canadensis]
MGSLPILTVIEQSQISPPPSTVEDDKSLPLTFFDFMWLRQPPVHYLFFYEHSITETQFLEKILPDLKQSLSTTLQYFYPFAGNLFAYSSPDKKPEIRYVEGDSVTVTSAKCHLDFNQLTSNQPRECDKFYHLIPILGESTKASDYIKIPLFSVQVTFFPNHGISIGMTNHHVLGDATTRFCFMNAWTSIARSGSTDSFLSNPTNLPFYDKSLVQNPKLDESYLKFVKAETLKEDYQPQMLSGPSNNKLRGTFVLTRNIMTELKKTVLKELPTLVYVSSFTVACAYIWSCLASTKNVDEQQIFGFVIDCRARLDPPIPTTYFGNCLSGCMAMENTNLLKGKQGFINGAKLFGESLHKVLTNKDGIVLDLSLYEDIFADGMLTTTMIGVAGTPKLKFYNMDFGWGTPKKVETVSIDYNGSISMNACKDSDQDLEIGVCLPDIEMEAFVRVFDDGLKTYI